MLRMLAFIAFLMLVTLLPAVAQVPTPEVAPQVQALRQSLVEEINKNIQFRTEVIALRDQMIKDKAELKRLKDKYEPRKTETKPEKK